MIINSFLIKGQVIVPPDSASVARAKDRHLSLYEKIAQEHQRLGAELEAKRALFESTSEIPQYDARNA